MIYYLSIGTDAAKIQHALNMSQKNSNKNITKTAGSVKENGREILI